MKTNIDKLRDAMSQANVQACIVPLTDPHCGEYTPEHWKTLQWLSGFTGSAGTLVVTADKAGLWTDSRYFLQADEQLKHTGIELFKAGLPDTPTPEQWLVGELQAGDTVGIEGEVFVASQAIALINHFEKNRLHVNTNFAPYATLWHNRPEIPMDKAFILPEKFTGESVRSKIQRLREALHAQKANCTILATLDSIAWLFNLRGSDIRYNPVAVSYALVSDTEAVLFIDFRKLTGEVADYLRGEGVTLAEYTKIDAFVTHYVQDTSTRFLVAPNKINYHLFQGIAGQARNDMNEVDVHPVDQMKAIKNATEIAGFRHAMQRDGVALMKFEAWLRNQLAENKTVTELDVSQKLLEFRSEQDYFVSESFETIAAYGAHGAIVHYTPTQESNAQILPQGLLLVDSGAHYLDGTTDLTRTIAVGAVTDEMKRDFTLLLKGHIALAQAKFPKGTVGMQLDILARQYIWQAGENYLHGTGHGVGHCLNVHEGPQSIRMNYNPAPVLPGMITSNEPGIYKAGRYGIRIENLLLCVPAEPTGCGEFYQFETLTRCPIDTSLIDTGLLTEEETRWLSDYNQFFV
ncbi:MAG: aminopeptidase P family protein [Candidatus Symbiothrix sp.]|nr:aminopeptidase P family protein [Candidatus Symbiothrix sp.]